MIAEDVKTYSYITTEDQFYDFLNDLRAYRLNFVGKRMRLGFDLETHFSDLYYKDLMLRYKDNPVPRCIKIWGEDSWEGLVRTFQIGFDPTVSNKQYVLDVQMLGRKIITDNLKQIIEEESILIGQFLSYDLPYLALQFNIYPEVIRDTMIVAQLRWLGDNLLNDNSIASFGLAALYSRLLPESLFIALTGMSAEDYESLKKRQQKSDWSGSLDESQISYAADDVRLIFYVYQALMDECNRFKKAYSKSELVNNIRIECDAVLEYGLMGVIGIGFDSDYHKNVLIPYLEKKAEDAEQKLLPLKECWIEVESAIKCPKTNPHTIKECKFAEFTSNQQTARIIIENLGYELPKTLKDNYSVAGDIINELFWESEPSEERDILELIIQYREAKSSLSKNGKNSLTFVHDDGRVHPEFYQIGTVTSRTTAKYPAMQTIPNTVSEDFPGYENKSFHSFRRSYVAKSDDKGRDHTLIVGDFSNEEVRIIGKYAKDQIIIKSFKNKEDLHQKTADNLEIKRADGKLFFLSSQYGAREAKIMRTLYIESGGKFKKTLDEVKELRATHFQLYSGLKEEIIRCEKYVESVFEPYDSLVEFKNRVPLLVGFTPTFKYHRIWCLTKEQENEAYLISKFGKEDKLVKSFKTFNKKTEKWSVWGNEFNQRKMAIGREYFNFLVQADAAVVLKIAVSAINKAFRAEGWHPSEATIVIVNHDEIVSDVLTIFADKAAEIQKKQMHDALYKILGETVPTVIETFQGSAWSVK